jgi:hypothetical protein
MENPSMKKPILLGLGAILMLLPVWIRSELAAWMQALLLAVGLWLLVWLLFAVIEYLQWLAQVAAWRQKKIDLMTPRMAEIEKQKEIIREIRGMTPQQIDLIKNYGPVATALAGDLGPLADMQTAGGRVPYVFIDLFMAQSSGRFLAPVGSWSEGTEERDYAQWLTGWLCDRGHADRAGGPYPARWRDGGRAQAIQAIYGERINNRREVYENGNALV